MSKVTKACCALLMFAVTALAQQRISGAHVTVSYVAGKVTFTIFNDSNRDIKAWQIRTVAHDPSGLQVVGGHMEEYGPLPNQNALLARKSVTFADPNNYGTAVSVTAKVTLVVYDDNSAETTDETALLNLVSGRKSFAYTAALLSDTMRTAAMDDQPTIKLKKDLQLLQSSKDKRINQALIDGAIRDIDNIGAGHERESIQERAADFQQLAKVHEGYANIRRLQ